MGGRKQKLTEPVLINVGIMTCIMLWGRPATLTSSGRKIAATLTNMIDGVTEQRRC